MNEKNEQENLKRLRNRNIFEEIKTKVEHVRATKEMEKEKEQPKEETYEELVKRILG